MTRQVAALFVLQLALLTIGLTRDYQLKHEDNNQLHATFARSHLRLGVDDTRGENYFFNPASRTGTFYTNHPPGPGLLLALVYGVTGHDGPATTRLVAVSLHLLSAWLFLGIARRVLQNSWEVTAAMLLFIVMPESAFFGRMVNHEVLGLPGALLLVRGYWESVRGTWPRARWVTAVMAGAVWTTVMGWPGFFAVAACVIHAAFELLVRRNPRARAPLLFLVGSGVVVTGAVLGHVLWILRGDVSRLWSLFVTRSAGEADPQPLAWIGRILELHWRYFGVTSAIALATVAVRKMTARGRRLDDGAEDIALIFLLAGAGYVGAFLFNATKHDYWQFLLLPASSLAIVLLIRRVRAMRRPVLRRAVAALVVLDLTAVTVVTLVRRHTKPEGYCIETVKVMRRNHL